MTTERAVIDTTNENNGPTIEESHKLLVDEGILQDDAAGADGTGEGQGEGAGADERPSWLPEKFKTPEDMAKAYAEAEKKLSQNGQKATEGDPKDAEGDDAAAAAVEKAGLDWGELSDQYAEAGELSEDAYVKLEKAGIPRDMVDAYIEGQEARAAIFENDVKSVAGGDEGYTQLIDWARSNLSDDEIDAFDRQVNSGDLGTAKNAAAGLVARMKLAEGHAPERQIDGKGGSSGDAYESNAQMEADMNDPRYSTDEAFRQKVYAKIARSNI